MILSYSRVSTDAQSEEGATSIPEQQRKIQAVAQLRGVSDVYGIQVYSDPGISGSIPLKDRPAGARMLADAQPTDIIVAVKLDRLFRSASDALITVERLKEGGIGVILVDMGVEPVTENGPSKLFFTMLAAFAEFERGRILERMDDGRKAKERTNGYLGGAPPYGWRVVGKGRGAQLEPVPTEQDTARLVLELARDGGRPSEITKALNNQGIKPRFGQQWFIPQVVRIIARNKHLERIGQPGVLVNG